MKKSAIVFAILAFIAFFSQSIFAVEKCQCPAQKKGSISTSKIDSAKNKDSLQYTAPLKTIPYPSGALYIDQGLCGAFMGGKVQTDGDSKSLFQWQGEMSYYYVPYFSGGFGFRIRAGEPSDSAQIILNRYFLLMRFHFTTNNFAFFIGPKIGVDNLNVIQDTTLKTSPTKILNPLLENNNVSFALDLGGGINFYKWFGLTLGSNIEYSRLLFGNQTIDGDNTLNIHLSPGVAFNLLNLSPSLHKVVPAINLYIEYQKGFLLLAQKNRATDDAWVGGLGLAF